MLINSSDTDQRSTAAVHENQISQVAGALDKHIRKVISGRTSSPPTNSLVYRSFQEIGNTLAAIHHVDFEYCLGSQRRKRWFTRYTHPSSAERRY